MSIKLKYIIFTLLVLMCQSLFAQDVEIYFPDSLFTLEEELTNEIIDPISIEIHPVFSGGMDSLWCFMEREFDKTLIDNYDSIKMVFVFFTIDTLGNIMDLEANPDWIKRPNFVKDQQILNEIKKVFMKLPAFEPGYINGKKTKYKFFLKINFPYEYRCK